MTKYRVFFSVVMSVKELLKENMWLRCLKGTGYMFSALK